MLFRLLLLMTVVPLVELSLLIYLGEKTAWWFPVGLVMLTGVVGASLSRWQGWRALERIRTELAQGKMPGGAILDGFLVFIAGVVLVTPGILTDLVGFLLLIPPTRQVIKRYLVKRFKHNFQGNAQGFQGESFQGQWTSGPGGPFPSSPDELRGGDRIIDSYVVDAEPPDPKD